MEKILRFAKSIFFPKSKRRPILWIGNNTGYEGTHIIALETMGFHVVTTHNVPDKQKSTYLCLIVIEVENIGRELVGFITRVRETQSVPILALSSIEMEPVLMNYGIDLCISPTLSSAKVAAYAMALIFQYDDAASWQDGNDIFPVVQGNIFVDQLNAWVDIDGRVNIT